MRKPIEMEQAEKLIAEIEREDGPLTDSQKSEAMSAIRHEIENPTIGLGSVKGAIRLCLFLKELGVKR